MRPLVKFRKIQRIVLHLSKINHAFLVAVSCDLILNILDLISMIKDLLFII